MTKEEVQQRVLKHGKPLPLTDFTWDSSTKTFTSTEDGLVIDFQHENKCTFITGHDCAIIAGHSCVFDTGGFCVFRTKDDCVFNTGWNSTFNTGSNCTFNAGGCYCTFVTGHSCKFKTDYYCVIVRRDTSEVIEIPKKTQVKLCPSGMNGYLTSTDGGETWFKCGVEISPSLLQYWYKTDKL